jgi:hypothetical protein
LTHRPKVAGNAELNAGLNPHHNPFQNFPKELL